MIRGGARAPTAFEWARVCLLAANLGWTTLSLGGFLPGTRVGMSILTAALLAVHLADPARGTRAHPAGWLFLPFLAWAAANAAWVTPVHWLGWIDWLNWAQGVAVFWVVLNGVVTRIGRRSVAAVVVALGLLSAALACYQHFVQPDWLTLGRHQAAQFIGRSSGTFGIPNSLGIFMALLIPPVGFLVLRPGRPAIRGLWAGALGLLAAGFVLAISRGAWLALAGAFALRPVLAPGRDLGRRMASAAASVAAAAAFGGIIYLSFPLMRERVHQLVSNAGERSRPVMWRAAWRIFEAHPVLGGGAGSYDSFFEGFRPEGNLDQPTYAHCDYLNTLADYGGVGFLLFFGAGALIAWRWRGAQGLMGAAATGLWAFGLHLGVDFDLKIPALAMIVATVAGLVTSETWPGPAEAGAPRGARQAAWGAAVAILAASFLWVIPKYRAEEARGKARERIDAMARAGTEVAAQREGLMRIRGLLAEAVRRDSSNAQAWADSAYADSLWAYVEPARNRELGAVAEKEAGRAVALCPVVAEFWIRLGVGFDMEGRKLEAGDCFVRALRIAPGRPDCWYYQAYHLSRDPAQFAASLAAADYALRLDPGYLLAQALRQRLAERLQHPP